MSNPILIPIVLVLVLLRAILRWLKARLFKRHGPPVFHCRRRYPREDPEPSPLNRRKPEWARQVVIRLAAHGLSCRKIEDNFNRNHGHRITIGKTWAHGVVNTGAEQIRALRRSEHNAVPPPMGPNKVWALDLTGTRTTDGSMQMVLGIIDHGSRALMRLKVVSRKCAWLLLVHLSITIVRHGKPEFVRTDNEGMFNSRLWRLALKMLNIGHQRIKIRQPWQNGRIERLFGTLKPLLGQLPLANRTELQKSLDEFTWFYNHVRVHLHLHGRTPMEVRRGDTPERVRSRAGNGQWVSALNGLMVGYHLRR